MPPTVPKPTTGALATPPPPTVRLTPAEAQAIRRAAEAHFGPGVRVWLFGSRIDPRRRGGDIDLYLEPAQPHNDLLARELRMHADLQRALGEQRIDIIVRRAGQPPRPIDREARRTGVAL